MKYLKLFEEYEDDGYDITKIPKNYKGKFRYLNDVKYKLGNEENTLAVSINDVYFTEGNQFYPNQVEKYKEYIKNGGAIDTFPVEVIDIASNLVDMLEWLEDSDNFDTYYDLLYGTVFYPKTNTETSRLIDKSLGKETEELEEKKPIELWKLEFDYPEYERINMRAHNLEEVFPKENRTKEEIELLNALKKVFEYFDEEKEYHLCNNFNHRLRALKELGKKDVLVEIM